MGRGFRSAEEIEITLGLPVIASIPLYESAFRGCYADRESAFWKEPGIFLMLPGGVKQEGMMRRSLDSCIVWEAEGQNRQL